MAIRAQNLTFVNLSQYCRDCSPFSHHYRHRVRFSFRIYVVESKASGVSLPTCDAWVVTPVVQYENACLLSPSLHGCGSFGLPEGINALPADLTMTIFCFFAGVKLL